MGNVVAIVGRPNVGKSTLYNRLVGSRDAITDDFSGVTRDRKYGFSDWNGKRFTVVDTGGFVHGSDDVFEAAIRKQVTVALEEAAVVLFMVDAQTGITDLDESIAKWLRRSKKPVLLVVNKVDSSRSYLEANEFWGLGFEHTFFIASISGSGTGDLLDAVVEYIQDEEEVETELPKFAIVGRPNVGKSSLTNALLGEERNIVTPIAGTTRDPIHSVYNKFGKEFMLIDTAGIRKKAKVEEDLEFYSVMRAIRAVEEADVCMLVVDATQGVEAQDLNILGLIQKRHKGVLILVNKWDLMEKTTNTARDYEAAIRRRIAPFNDVPILFISVHEKQRIFQAVEAALEVYENRSRRVKTSELNERMMGIIADTQPPSVKGRFPKFKYVTQLPTPYPAFAFFVNNPNWVRKDYVQFLENKLREHYAFTGVPMEVYMRAK
ncbi:MAG TPA: ribosome biogenesis GTPase Der [Saprospiraceae bacterium]|nr:ribosome biogenesis GTPase Der [Saprospiraceae bacterium]HNG89139.1 ribosome biogenesis GTPase Der [Saprospiraceae bacterium]